MAVVFHAAAAQCRARQAQPAEIHILSVSLGLRASPYLEPIPATLEIHAAALLCFYAVVLKPCQEETEEEEQEEKRGSLKKSYQANEKS